MAKKRLGIDALFASTIVPDADAVAVRKIALNKIIPNPNQPRRRLEPAALTALVESIRQSGILQPIIVRELKSGEAPYQIVAGERRWQAAKLAALTEIPAIIRTLSDEESLQLALVENLQREDLNPVEETEGYLALLKLKLRDEIEFAAFVRPNDTDPFGDVLRLLFAMNNNRTAQKEAQENGRSKVNNNVVINLTPIVESVFSAIGRTNWLSFIQHRLPLRRLPADVLTALRNGKIEYTKARAIGRLTSETLKCSESQALALRKTILNQAIAESLSLIAIRRLIEAEKNKLTNVDKNKVTTTEHLQVLARQTAKELKELKLSQLSEEHQKQLQEKLEELTQLVELVRSTS